MSARTLVSKERILVVGRNDPEDFRVLFAIAEWLRLERGRFELAFKLDHGLFEEFDMWTRPEKGDAMDAIDVRTSLVVALRLYGMDEVMGQLLFDQRCYNRENSKMLDKCMEAGAIFACWGDQPSRGVQDKFELPMRDLCVYEPAAKFGIAAGA